MRSEESLQSQELKRSNLYQNLFKEKKSDKKGKTDDHRKISGLDSLIFNL
jgi:hypothetical protein